MQQVNRIVAITLSAVMMASAAFAADLKLPRLAPPRADISRPIQDNQPNCASWTDDCVNCSRGAGGGAPVCSNVGFACQPNAVRCLSR